MLDVQGTGTAVFRILDLRNAGNCWCMVQIYQNTWLNLFYLGWQFQQHSDSSSSRRLFRFSLIHLPLLMVIMLLTKKQWYLTSAGKDEEQVMVPSHS
jgi:Polyprenyltransferase (cytochrome oxidase assembly factor)